MPPRTPDIARREKRARILEAAYEVCARRGVEGARMEEVAALAQVSKGTLYHFFESKQDLFLASMIDSYEESLRIFDAAQDAGAAEPLARLDQILEGLTKVLVAMATRMTVHYQAWGVVAGDARARERLYGFLRDFFHERSASIAEVIRDAQRRGSFAADADVASVTDGIMALLSGFLYRATFDPEHADPGRLSACFDALVRDAFYAAPPTSTRGEGDDG
jgi:TetR/AcrR family transcriptional regulator